HAGETHSDCTADNQTGCVATATYRSADTSAFAASDIISGKTIAGVSGSIDLSNLTACNIKSGGTINSASGDFPSATYPLAGATVTDDLPALDKAMATGSYEYWDSAGNRLTGTVADSGAVVPTTSSQTIEAAGTVYRSVVVDGDADLVAGN